MIFEKLLLLNIPGFLTCDKAVIVNVYRVPQGVRVSHNDWDRL